jgi:hypothetical protein
MATRRWTIAAIKAANRRAGGNFFDKETMRFWKSSILPNVYTGTDGVYFVTGDASFSGKRVYWVRKFHPSSGRVDSVGDAPYNSKSEALSIAKTAAGGAQSNPHLIPKSWKQVQVRRLSDGRVQVKIANPNRRSR